MAPKLLVFYLILKLKFSTCIQWERVQCSSDSVQEMPEGVASDIGRFPWLGIVQHTFYLGGSNRFAITGGVLVHPGYAIAPAEDIARIKPDTIMNNTKFIVWYSQSIKFSLEVREYILHPEYERQQTMATLALLQLVTLGETGVSDFAAAVLPVCLPVSGAGTFSDLYTVKLSDENGVLQKEVYKMKFVPNKDCEEFYYQSQLTYRMMSPVFPLCAVAERTKKPCVWDGGSVLITRQSWGHWKLLGFGVRGPGCGAPSRFLNIHDYLPWLDEVISNLDPGESINSYKIVFRRLSPYKFQMYKADSGAIPNAQGQCGREDRGGVLYKDSSEILINKNFAQGFFFVAVSQLASFLCVTVNLGVQSRTNAAIWVEHNCHRDVSGLAPGMQGPDVRKIECFMYFKSTAFIEFRFTFSFRAVIEVALYGKEESPRRIPNPFFLTETTDPWEPTNRLIKYGSFVPHYKSYYDV